MPEPLTLTLAGAAGAALSKLVEKGYERLMVRDKLLADGEMVQKLWGEVHRMQLELRHCQEQHLECQTTLARMETLYGELKADFEALRAQVNGGN